MTENEWVASSTPMRTWNCAVPLALLLGFLTLTAAQPPAAQPDRDKLPAPGTTGNKENVPFIGKKDPQGNPVRLAKATGHVSNYSEDKVAPYVLPDPLVTFDKRRVTTAETWLKQRRPEVLKFFRDEIYGAVPGMLPGSPGRLPRPTTRPATARPSGGASLVGWVTGRMAPE